MSPKSSTSTMKAGGSATHDPTATPMNLHGGSSMDPDAEAFQPVSNMDAGTMDEPNPSS